MISSHRCRCCLLALCLLYALAAVSSSDEARYTRSLLKFKQSLTNAAALDGWREPAAGRLCSWNTPLWTGCLCSNGSFIGLRLDNMSLAGAIDVDALADLPIYTLSVAGNNFSGRLPDLKKLPKLRSLYLTNNGFGGEIDGDAFAGMKAVRKVVLTGNRFSGRIPASLAELPRLVNLQAQGNRFEGRIPAFWQRNLTVNLSNNRLRGAVPIGLSNQNASSFYGNLGLCGKPLSPCKPKRTSPKLAFIAAAMAAAAFSAFLTLFLIYRRRPKPLKYSKSYNGFPTEGATRDKKPPQKKKRDDGKQLTFVSRSFERFELEELLRASAQVLGSGSFGSSYKASLLGCHSYVVRRFTKMNSLGKEDFYQHMSRLGRLSHPNLVPLVAFHYRKDEKLLITKFVENGSLASHLHGKRGSNQTKLDWKKRLKIIKGIARGLAYLYKELPTSTLPHGHLKSSNVVLDKNYEPLLADYALAAVMDKDHAQQLMAAYKSPESTQSEGVTRKSDVWSLGILILEVLTGQFPASYLKQGRGPSSDLATWVSSVVREEWKAEVLDKEMGCLERHGEGQMLRLLKIGMCCCEWDVAKRWDLREAVERIQELESDE